MKNIKVNTQFTYYHYKYFVSEVMDNKFIAKRFVDGCYKEFTENDLDHIIFTNETYPIFVAVDKDGTPLIFPDKPTKNKYGNWVYETSIEGEYISLGFPITWNLMLKLVNKPLTNMDEPVEIY